MHGAGFAVRFGLGIARLAGGGEVAVERLALLLAGGFEGVDFREQRLAFLLRGVALVGELFAFGAVFRDRRIAAGAGGFEFARELGALGGDAPAVGLGGGDRRHGGGEFRGEPGFFGGGFFVRGAKLGERLLGLAARGFGGGVQLGGLGGVKLRGGGFALRFFGVRGFFLRLAELGGKAVALLAGGGEFLPERFHVGGIFHHGGCGGSGGEPGGERVFFGGEAVALGEQFFDALAVAVDVGLELLDGPRLPRLGRRRGHGGHRCRGEARAGVLEFRREPGAGGRRRFHLIVRFLERAGGFGVAFARRVFKFAPHGRVRLLDVRGAFAVQPIGGRELPFEFDLGLFFTAQVERGLALV